MPSGSFHLEEATIVDIHAAFRSGELTAHRLVELYLARVEAYDHNGPELNSIATVNFNALEEAAQIDRYFEQNREFIGPLHGIPVLVKDQAETAGIRTTFGSVAFEDYVPDEDATIVKKLKDAGAIILAKTNLPDFATSWFAYSSFGGVSKNPYALDRDPGGSSSGTGAGVAANLGAVGIGEDTGGSIRIPASFDNLVGARVTTGLISRKGMSPLVVFQDTAGPMTRTVRDSAIMLDTLVGFDEADPFTAVNLSRQDTGSYAQQLADNRLTGARIGILREAFGSSEDPDCSAVNTVVEEAIDTMRRGGAEIVDPVTIPGLQDFIGTTSLYLSQSRHDIDQFLSNRPDAHSVDSLYNSERFHQRLDLFIAIAQEAPTTPEEDPNYYKGLAAREQFRRAILGTMARHGLNALLYPTTKVLPPTRKEVDDWKWTVLTFPTNTLIAAQADVPSVAMPAGFSSDNVPVGIELVGAPYGEADLLSIAHSYEAQKPERRQPESTPRIDADPS